MDPETLINNLNDHCIWLLLRFLNTMTILAFGATNTRFRAIVSNLIAERQEGHGRIRFFFYTSIAFLHEILLHFGEHFFLLVIEFGATPINMRIFRDDDDNCMIDNVDELTLRAYVNEIMAIDVRSDDSDDDGGAMDYQCDGYYDFGNTIDRIVDQFRQNVQNIVDSINNNEIRTMTRLTFHHTFGLLPRTYNNIDFRWFDQVESIVQGFFGELRRGNLNFSYTRDFQVHSIELILEFFDF